MNKPPCNNSTDLIEPSTRWQCRCLRIFQGPVSLKQFSSCLLQVEFSSVWNGNNTVTWPNWSWLHFCSSASSYMKECDCECMDTAWTSRCPYLPTLECEKERPIKISENLPLISKPVHMTEWLKLAPSYTSINTLLPRSRFWWVIFLMFNSEMLFHHIWVSNPLQFNYPV